MDYINWQNEIAGFVVGVVLCAGPYRGRVVRASDGKAEILMDSGWCTVYIVKESHTAQTWLTNLMMDSSMASDGTIEELRAKLSPEDRALVG